MTSLPIYHALRLSLLCAVALLALGTTSDNVIARPTMQAQHGLKGHYYTEGLMRNEVAYDDEYSLPIAPFKQPDAVRVDPQIAFGYRIGASPRSQNPALCYNQFSTSHHSFLKLISLDSATAHSIRRLEAEMEML